MAAPRNMDRPGPLRATLAGLRGHRETVLQTFWALSGNITNAAGKWGMLLILARFTDPATVGQYALAFAISAPVMMFCDMRLRQLLAADSQNDYRFADYLKARIGLASAAFAMILVFAFLAFGGGRFFQIVALVALAKTVESYGDIFYGLFLKNKAVRNMSISLMLKGLVSVTAFLVAIVYTNDIVVACLTLPIAWGLPLVFYDIPAARRLLGPKQRLLELKPRGRSGAESGAALQSDSTVVRLVRASAVLGVVALLGSLFSNVTNYVIGSTLGDAQLGIYAAIAYVGIAGRLVATSLIQPVIPRIAAAYRGDDIAGFTRGYIYLMITAAVLGLGGCGFVLLFGELFLDIVYGPAFAEHSFVFLMAMIATAVFYFVQFHWYVFTAMKQLNIQLVLSAATIVVMLGLCLIWVPVYGIPGAIGAEIAGFGLHVLLAIWFVRKTLKAKLVGS